MDNTNNNKPSSDECDSVNRKPDNSPSYMYSGFGIPQNIITDPELIKELEAYATPTGGVWHQEFLLNTSETGSFATSIPAKKPSFEELLHQAERGIAEAQNDLGLCYLLGEGADIDRAKGFYWLLVSAKQGFPFAIANLGRCYLEGVGVDKSIEHALVTLGAANLMGVVDAGIYLLNNIEINELIKLSEQGNALAQCYLGICYINGKGIKQDIEKAFELFDMAASQKTSLAFLCLGRCYTNRFGVEKDLLRAQYYLTKAVEYAAEEVGELGVRYVSKDLYAVRDAIIENIPCILVKVIPICKEEGKPEDQYVKDFLAGRLFMKTLDQFGDITKRDASSNNTFRGDILEGFSESFGLGYNPHLHVLDENGNIEQDGLLGSLDVLKLREKVFCLTAIEFDKAHQCFIRPDARMKEFGEYAVVITDVEEFLRRVHSAVDEMQQKNNAHYWLSYGRVKYGIDFSQPFKYDEFRKSDSYSWQKELRIIIDFSEGRFSPEILGDVTDFAKLTFPGEIKKDTTDPDSPSRANALYLDIGDISRFCTPPMSTDEFVVSGKTQIPSDIEEPKNIVPYQLERKPRPTFCKGVGAFQSNDGSVCLGVTAEAFFSAVL